MRRKSGNENALQEYLGRGEVGRLRSPVLRKNKSRPKIEVFSFVQPARPKHRKCEDGSRKYEGKGEGLTNCTHKSKPERKKTKYSSKSKKYVQPMNESKVMYLINLFASKIQRQWRRYWTWKCSQMQCSDSNISRYPSSTRFLPRRSITKYSQNKPILDLQRLGNDLYKSSYYPTYNNEYYNKAKYKSYNSSSDMSVSRVDSSYQGRKKVNCQIVNEVIIIRIDDKQMIESASSTKNESKEQDHDVSKKYMLEQSEVKQGSYKGKACKTGQGIEKYPFETIVRKCRKAIYVKKLKKLLSIETKFSKNLITQRSYQAVLEDINEYHRKQMQTLQVKEGTMRAHWYELFSMYQNNREYGGAITGRGNEVSMYMEIEIMDMYKWDFNSSASSAHKSFGPLSAVSSGNKLQSIEVMLKELDVLDERGDRSQRNCRCDSFERDDLEDKIEQEEKEEQFSRDFKKKECKLQFVESMSELDELEGDQDRILKVFDPIKYLPLQRSLDVRVLHTNVSKAYLYHNFYKIIIYPIQLLKNDELCVKSPDKPNILIKEHCSGSQNSESKILGDFGTPFGEKLFVRYAYLSSIKKETVEITEVDGKIYNGQYIICVDKTVENSKNIEKIYSIGHIEAIEHIDISKQQYINENYKPIYTSTLSPHQQLIFRRFADYLIMLNNLRTAKSVSSCMVYAYLTLTSCRIPIDLDSVNNWLLDISHFILDNYQLVVLRNLVNIKQPTTNDLLSAIHLRYPYNFTYEVIPQKVYKYFQFGYGKSIFAKSNMQYSMYEKFMEILYTFHRVLVDSLNLALLDELARGRHWLYVPWRKPKFRMTKRVEVDFAKQALYRAINIVSNWSEYALGKLVTYDEISYNYAKQFKVQYQYRLQLLARYYVLDASLDCSYFYDVLMFYIGRVLFDEEVLLCVDYLAALKRTLTS